MLVYIPLQVLKKKQYCTLYMLKWLYLGSPDDWMSAKLGMIGFTIELRDTGNYGFLLPPAQIVPQGEEAWKAVKFFVDSLVFSQ